MYRLLNTLNDAKEMMKFYTDKTSKGYQVWYRIYNDTKKQIKSLEAKHE